MSCSLLPGCRGLRPRRVVTRLSLLVEWRKLEYFKGSRILYHFLMAAIFAALTVKFYKNPSLTVLWVDATLLSELNLQNTSTNCLQGGNGSIGLAFTIS